MSDMPERIFVDAEGKDTDWFTINHLREVNPDEVVIRYAWTEEYVRADKYAELEERLNGLVSWFMGHGFSAQEVRKWVDEQRGD